MATFEVAVSGVFLVEADNEATARAKAANKEGELTEFKVETARPLRSRLQKIKDSMHGLSFSEYLRMKNELAADVLAGNGTPEELVEWAAFLDATKKKPVGYGVGGFIGPFGG